MALLMVVSVCTSSFRAFSETVITPEILSGETDDQSVVNADEEDLTLSTDTPDGIIDDSLEPKEDQPDNPETDDQTAQSEVDSESEQVKYDVDVDQLHPLVSESVDGAELSVYVDSDSANVVISQSEICRTEPGLEAMTGYTIDSTDGEERDSLWVKAEPSEDFTLQEGELVALYSVKDGNADKVIIPDISEGDELYSIGEDVDEITLVKDTGYRQQSLEITRDENDEECNITLEGLLPKNATATAVDRTEERAEVYATEQETADSEEKKTVLLAYDITIYDGETEYQPGEEKPVKVEITAPELVDYSSCKIVHIDDNGQKEEISEYDLDDGKISFFATGFSLYEIVVDENVVPNTNTDIGWKKLNPDATDWEDTLLSYGGTGGSGIYISHTSGTYATNKQEETVAGTEGRTGISRTVTSKNDTDTAITNGAAPYFFEKDLDSGKYYIYCFDKNAQGVSYRKYVIQSVNVNKNGCLSFVTSTSEATPFAIEKYGSNTFRIIGTDNYCWNRKDSKSNMAFASYDNLKDANAEMNLWYYDPLADDPYQLDGKSYRLVSSSDGKKASGLVADSKTNFHSLKQYIVRSSGSTSGTRLLYLDSGRDLTAWTFTCAEEDKYYLSANVGGVTKYLQISDNGLALVDTADDNCKIKVTPGPTTGSNKGKIKLSNGDQFITYDTENNGFVLTTNGALSGNWLSFAAPTSIDEKDKLSYSAEKVSVSDTSKLKNGSKVIIYTRIWNDISKAYEYYMVDHDGSLYPCFDGEDSILWMGDAMESLQWDFIEYYWDPTADPKVPNYYYELYNPYSKKYLAPQLKNAQILSDSPVGINLPGRKDGEYYSDIIAWDDYYKAYAAVGNGTDKVISVPYAQSQTYYFAILKETEEGRLHEVETVDNSKYGITMRMVDFAQKSNMSEITSDYFNGDKGDTPGLLYSNLREVTGADGKKYYYPVAKATNKSFYNAFKESSSANHLFIQSVHEESGYFEFDSCQNFATLCNDDGSIKNDFTVYQELGTSDLDGRTTLKHGQFYPYNIICPGLYPKNNPENLYSMNAKYGVGNENLGKLSDDDPRKHEKLYAFADPNDHSKIVTPNTYLGMELSASFVQTPSGLDAWGHDVIFEFTGDDDFWLFVDNELVLDLGGIHSAVAGKVNFRTGEVITKGVSNTLYNIFKKNMQDRGGLTQAEIDAKLDEIFDLNEEGNYVFQDYSDHTMNIYYMERGAGASNLHMRFNLSAVTAGDVLLKKEVTGNNAGDLDFELTEYPYQIWYRTQLEADAGLPGTQLKNQGQDHINITYQNSTKAVKYQETYTPPNSENSYEGVYFLTPGKNAEVHFPDNTFEYRIVECGVNTQVYDHVYVNGVEVDGESIGNTNRSKYESDWVSVADRPSLVYENHVEDEGIRTLSIIKKLYDDQGNLLTEADDPTTFTYRLYLSNGVSDEVELADRYNYYIQSPNGFLCKWNADTQRYEETPIPAEDKFIRNMSDEYRLATTFYTSIYGSIANVPAGYIVQVPGLPIGMRFKVEERPSEMPDGYILEGYESDNQDITYLHEEQVFNEGEVRAGYSPQMFVKNRRGWSLTVKKSWSDIAYMTDYDPIYIALYDSSDTLVPGTERCIDYPNTEVNYFFNEDFSDYHVRELILTGNNITEDANGVVTGYETIVPVDPGGEMEVWSTDKHDIHLERPYVAGYTTGIPTGSGPGIENVRTDTIRNTRKGGVMLRLFEWNSTVPLAGGVFTLTCNGTTIDSYTSDDTGFITVLYEDFDPTEVFTLTEIKSPDGYIGLHEPISFTLSNDTGVNTFTDPNAPGWADHKLGDSGIIAYIDTYNKPYELKVRKYDQDDQSNLAGGHFALYWLAYSPIGGYKKSKNPLTGYEDIVTDSNGLVSLISLAEGKKLVPGTYYLTETSPPEGYAGLEGDIIFTISDLGEITIDSAAHTTYLKSPDTEGDPYLIEVPNHALYLTITKTVTGLKGSTTKEFDFYLIVEDDDGSKTYSWTKNGVEQTVPLRSYGTFTMKHDDTVVIKLPINAKVTIEEDPAGYIPSFKLGDADATRVSKLTFTLSEDMVLAVTNTRNVILPTGIDGGFVSLMISLTAAFLAVFLLKRRLRKEVDGDAETDDDS